MYKRQVIAQAGLDLTVAVVSGDDLSGQKSLFADRGLTEMFSGRSFPTPDSIASINAYLGAFPIAKALDRGADIVIIGRCVDSAVTLGACIHAFGWQADDLDRLAGGSLAGHILECGPQATGGNFTDWQETADSLTDIGDPIAEISSAGSVVCTKPELSGGVVTVGSVAEQVLYEIGDPQAYVLPDVVCDFSEIRIDQSGPDRVRISGALGYPPPHEYKVCVTYADGFRGGLLLPFNGFDARAKALVFAKASIARATRRLTALDLPEFTETSAEVFGGVPECCLEAGTETYQEVVLKICLLYTSPSPRDGLLSRMPSSA